MLPPLRPLLRPLLRAGARRFSPRSIATSAKPQFKPRHLLLASAFVVTVAGTSIYTTKKLLPMSDPILSTPAPAPGSPEELRILQEIEEKANNMGIVKSLRANKDFVERTAWEGFSEEEKTKKFTAGVLKGSRGIAWNRIWFNERDGSSVSVVALGGGLCGFPGVVHGGVLATMMDEAFGRTAMESFPGRNGVTARLSVDYKRPTLQGGFVIIRTWLVESNGRKATVKGQIEDEAGNISVLGEGLFVVPKGWQLDGMPEGF
ncbi:hypothetical protein RUND412_008670 [Rhizina undulata]